MRILFVANGFPPMASAGVESHTYHLAQTLIELGHTVHVFSRDADLSVAEYTMRQVVVDGIPVTRVVNNLLDVSTFEQLYNNPTIDTLFADVLARFQPDVVHIQHLIGLSLGCLTLAQAQGIPTVLTLHDYWYICPTVQLIRPEGHRCIGAHHGANCFDCVRLVPRQMEQLTRAGWYSTLHRAVPAPIRHHAFNLLSTFRARQEQGPSPAIAARVDAMRTALDHVAQLQAVSQHVKDVYVEYGLPAATIDVVPPGMEVAAWQAVERIPAAPDAPLRVGYVGTFTPVKGAEVLIQAFQQVPGNMTLDLCGFEPPGHAYPAHVKALAAKDSRITWRGPLTPDPLREAYSRWDVLMMPVLWEETFSFVAREALLAGVPIVASKLPVLPELISDGVNGYLLPPGDVAAWAACLAHLRDNPNLVRSLNARASGPSVACTFAQQGAAQIEIYLRVLQGT